MGNEKRTTNDKGQTIGSAVVLGGGIGGMQAALDMADSGLKVYLVEESSAIGGRMTQLDKTFPTNECSMCVVSPKLVDCARHRNIEILTNIDLEKIEGEAGNFNITFKKRPRYVDEEKCTGCNACVINCPVTNVINLIPEDEKEKIELLPEVEQVVKNIIDKNKDKKGALMLILQSINAAYNYFAIDVLKYVSRELNTPVAEVLRIVTFYNTFSLKPRGKHMINVCMGTTCYVKGGDRILDSLSEILDVPVDGTSKDKLFTLKPVRCLGCCSIAPAMMINDKVYGRLKIGEIKKILKDYK